MRRFRVLFDPTIAEKSIEVAAGGVVAPPGMRFTCLALDNLLWRSPPPFNKRQSGLRLVIGDRNCRDILLSLRIFRLVRALALF